MRPRQNQIKRDHDDIKSDATTTKSNQVLPRRNQIKFDHNEIKSNSTTTKSNQIRPRRNQIKFDDDEFKFDHDEIKSNSKFLLETSIFGLNEFNWIKSSQFRPHHVNVDIFIWFSFTFSSKMLHLRCILICWPIFITKNYSIFDKFGSSHRVLLACMWLTYILIFFVTN